MKISVALILSTAIPSVMVSSVVAGGGCVGAPSDRDQCLCGCIRSGYDCETGEYLMIGADEDELKARCKAAIIAGGPCKWDPNAVPADGSSCLASCPYTNLCGGGDGGGGDGPDPEPVDKCDGVTCAGSDCPGSCCIKTKGSCGGPKRLRR